MVNNEYRYRINNPEMSGTVPHDAPRDSAGLSRRALLHRAAVAGTGALLPAAGVITAARSASAAHVRTLSRGDVAILRFLAAAEIIESDLWLQYAELGGTQDNELPGLTGGSPPYINALEQ